MLSTARLSALLPDVIHLSQEAGRAILQVYERGDLGTTYKEDHSPLTDADLASHRLIQQGLHDLEASIPLLSEESKQMGYEQRQGWTHFWLVDPLDGTKEFIKRNGQFTVNIALISNGSPCLGVVHAPVMQTTYWAASGLGAFKQHQEADPQPIQVNPRQNVLKVVASRSHAGVETDTFLQKLQVAWTGEVEFLSMGSSLKLCLVADGQADLYPRFGPTMEWDTGAAQAVVEEAGGQVTTLQGAPLRYNKPDLLNPFFMVSSHGVADLWPRLI